MKSTEPLRIKKRPFPSYMEKPEEEKIRERKDWIYGNINMEKGYRCHYLERYTDQICELDKEIKALNYHVFALEDQEEASFFLFERGGITEILRCLRILSVSQAFIYTIKDLEDIKGLPGAVYKSITEAIQSSEEPEEAAVLLTNKNCNELKEAIEKIPAELIRMVRKREWMAAYDQWEATYLTSYLLNSFYEDIDGGEYCRYVIWGASDEVYHWLEEDAPDSLITHIEFPHKNIGYGVAIRRNFEEQCTEMILNAPLKGLTVKLVKSSESDIGFLIECWYPDTNRIYG